MKAEKFLLETLIPAFMLSAAFIGCRDSVDESTNALGDGMFGVEMEGCDIPALTDDVELTLIAGQHIDAGTVTAVIAGNDLVVTVSTSNGWTIDETHLWVDTEPPPEENPAPGQFPESSGDLSGIDATTYTFTLPLERESIDFSCPGDDRTLFLALHAALSGDPMQDGGTAQETAWAEGEPFVPRGNWATYFEVTLTCLCEPDTEIEPPPEVCETAFAFDADGTCFRGIDLDDDGKADFSRWGWTVGPLDTGEYDFDLYAGAGQCDLEKGAHVGTVHLEFVDETVTVTYWTLADLVLEETHVYIGEEILPRQDNKSHKFTVAPGQYPYGGDMTSYIVTDVSSPIHLIAHAVVCGDFD